MNIPRSVKAISFDGDGTLWDFQKVMRHSLGRVLDELQRTHPDISSRLTIDSMIETRNRVAAELKGQVINLETVRLEAFRRTLVDLGRPDDALTVHLNQVYLRHRFEDLKLYEDVLPVLNKLKTGYVVGILSNGNSYPEHTGLRGIFRFVVFSQDYGYEKPDRRLFEEALAKAGCDKAEFLHVGDSMESDIIGASNTGVKSVWLNRNGIHSASSVKPDYEITSLSELLGGIDLTAEI